MKGRYWRLQPILDKSIVLDDINEVPEMDKVVKRFLYEDAHDKRAGHGGKIEEIVHALTTQVDPRDKILQQFVAVTKHLL